MSKHLGQKLRVNRGHKMSQIHINPKRNFGGKPLGEYNPAQDAFDKFKGIAPPAPAVSQKAVDWSRLDLNKVETMVERNAGVAIWDALAKAKEQGKVIVPNSVHDRMLVETEHYKNDAIKAGYAAWTGTAIIYEEPDKVFGETVTFTWQMEQGTGQNKKNVEYSLTFTVPEKFRGKKNCALLMDHPDFEIVSVVGKANSYELKVTDEASIQMNESFPKVTQKWYHYDEGTRIPVGEPLDGQATDNTMRYLWRQAGAYCGLLARGYNIDGQRGVYANDRPSYGLGVHAVPLADAPKKE